MKTKLCRIDKIVNRLCRKYFKLYGINPNAVIFSEGALNELNITSDPLRGITKGRMGQGDYYLSSYGMMEVLRGNNFIQVCHKM